MARDCQRTMRLLKQMRHSSNSGGTTLSFLGLGSAPPTPEWGMMVSDGVGNFNKFWIAGFPGLAIFTMAVGANFIGDGMRDLLDPKLRKQF